MIDSKKTLSFVERLVRDHPQGTPPTEGLLDSPEKIDAYVERMQAATEEGLRRDRRARQESAAQARTRRVD
jgi:hypothetical protein